MGKKQKVAWPDWKLRFLNKHYPDAKWSLARIAARVGKSEVATKKKASRMGLHRRAAV